MAYQFEVLYTIGGLIYGQGFNNVHYAVNYFLVNQQYTDIRIVRNF